MGSGKDGRLAIPLSELEGFGDRLRSIKSRMNGTKRMFEDYREDIGDGGVVDKLEEFESGWEDGREDIGQQIDALSKMADTVVREITAFDGDLGKKLKKNVKKEDRGKVGGNSGGGSNGPSGNGKGRDDGKKDDKKDG